MEVITGTTCSGLRAQLCLIAGEYHYRVFSKDAILEDKNLGPDKIEAMEDYRSELYAFTLQTA